MVCALLLIAPGCESPARSSPTIGAIDSTAASPPAVDDTAESPGAARDPAAVLALEGGGLRVFVAPYGSARTIPFGTPAGDARAIIDRVIGRGALETGSIADCAAHYARYDNGLVLLLVDDRFVGWTVREESRLTTASGIGIGSTRAQLEDVYSTSVRRTNLGVEFTAGALAGVLEGPEPSARIRHLWAGIACIAR